jgi:putative endonuclease
MSNKAHRLYVGATIDLVRRVQQHEEKTYPSSFTARYNYDRLVYFEVADSFHLAKARERYLKGLNRARKVALMQQHNPNWLDLSVQFDDLLMAR